jgi:hypothetical protein
MLSQLHITSKGKTITWDDVGGILKEAVVAYFEILFKNMCVRIAGIRPENRTAYWVQVTATVPQASEISKKRLRMRDVQICLYDSCSPQDTKQNAPDKYRRDNLLS